jgi:hypothetical protein
MVKACQIVLPVAASSARNQRYFGRTAGPNLNGEEVGCDQQFPVLSEELLPGCISNSLRRWLDAMALQNVGNCVAGHFMAQIRQ